MINFLKTTSPSRKVKRLFIGILVASAFFSGIYFLWGNMLSWDERLCDCDVQPGVVVELPTMGGSATQSGIQALPKAEQKVDLDRGEIPARGYYLYINLDSYKMDVYKNGQIIKTYPVSGGKRATPSPVGTYKIISKGDWGEGFGGSWLGISVPWGKYGIHGTVYPWVIGHSNSSKGCIRMKNKDAREVYNMVPHGTLVKIVQDNPPFRLIKNGDVGSDVLKMQKILKELDYFKGGCDGKFGYGLENAVRRFQKDFGLSQTGFINKGTFDLIQSFSRDFLE